jgi:type I restriction enzyme S subunit
VAEPYLECPSTWRRCTLEPDPANGIILRVESGSTPSTQQPEYWDGDTPWLTPKDIVGNPRTLYVSRTARTITERGLASSGAKLLPPGTVMLTKRAPVGAVAVNAVPMATNQGFLNFACGKLLRPLYLAYWFQANQPYLDLIANGSTYPELYKSDLFEFQIAVPPLEEQDRILGFLSALSWVMLVGSPIEQTAMSHKAMLAIEEQTQRLARLSDAVLPLLLSGKLDLSALPLSCGLRDIKMTRSPRRA